MPKKSVSGADLTNAITSEDILGKDVIDKEGEFIGVVEKVLIDKKSLSLIGIEIDKGFLKSGFVVGKDYIDRVTDYALILKIRIVYGIKGLEVFDNMGVKLGKVKDIKLQGTKNKVKELIVSTSFFKEDLVISGENIEVIGRNVILNIAKEEIKNA